MPPSHRTARGPLSPTRALLFGALTVGTLDALDAIVFFGIRNGATPMRIFQAIAAGVLGQASFQGGLASAALGVVCHYTVALGIVTTFFLVSRRLRALTDHAVPAGIAYGIVAYLVMNLVVVPMSAATPAHKTLAVIVNGVLIHMFGVGLPSALWARAAAVPHAGHPDQR